MSHSLSSRNGFTLTEIVIVVIIIGVISALIVPRFISTMERVRASEGVQHLTSLLGAQKAYQLENGAYATDPADLDVEITTASNFVVPPTVANPGNPIVNPIARIRRIQSYWLEINEIGDISCVAAAPNNFTCAQAGY